MKFNIKQRNLAYLVGVIFLTWHSIALVFTPAPWSQLTAKITPLLQPYMTFFNMSNGWAFYTPDPSYGGILLRYTVQTKQGILKHFKLIEDMPQSDPSYFRFTSYHAAITHSGNEKYYQSLATYLCRMHQDLNPTAITFTIVKQAPISPADYLRGARPLDINYVTLTNLRPIGCMR